MNRNIACGIVLLAITLSLGADAEKPRSVFSSLEVGQEVNLKEEGQVFTLVVMEEDLPLSHKVIEIGEHFVVLESVAGIETTIPVYAVKGLVRMRGR